MSLGVCAYMFEKRLFEIDIVRMTYIRSEYQAISIVLATNKPHWVLRELGNIVQSS